MADVSLRTFREGGTLHWAGFGAARRASAVQVAGAPRRLRTRSAAVGGFCLVAGLWLILHAYTGIQIDARIYMGRAMADLAPATIGRDLMFVHDGQSAFSVYPRLARLVVGRFGVEAGATLLALAGVAVWFTAAVALVMQLVSGRLRWAMLACLAVLPNHYGGFITNPFGEALAVPRPFAEAGVMAALACALAGRRAVALALLLAAGLFHPLMALCGVGVVFVMAATEDRRWLAPAALLVGVVLLAGVLRLPVAERLFQRIDPVWLEVLHRRSPYLFPALWSLSTWSQSAVQLATVLIAAGLLQGRARTLLLGSALVAGGGVSLAFVLGDVFPSLLVVQLQPWRALWLSAVLGSAGFALCAARLWPQGAGGRLVLAVLAMGWLAPESPAGLCAAALALVLFGLERRAGGLGVGELAARVALGLLGLLALRVVQVAPSAVRFIAAMPPPRTGMDLVILSLGLQTLVVPPLAVWAVLAPPGRLERPLRLAVLPLGLAVLAAGVLAWDRQPFAVRPGMAGEPGLTRLLASRPGPVQWIDGDVQAWTLAGRAAWGSEVQAASIVFSRPLAMAWRARMDRLVALGLASPDTQRFVDHPAGEAITRPTAQAMAALCRAPDAPAWIISHLIDGERAPALAGTLLWSPSASVYLRDGPSAWRRVSRYALVPCGAAIVTPPSAARPPDPLRRG